MFLDFYKSFNVGFFMDDVQAASFKLCMIITLLGVCQFKPGWMTLALFQGHRCVKIIKWQTAYCFLDSCLLCKCCMFATLKRSSMVYMTGVYLRGMINTIFPVLHLNVSHVSVCFSYIVGWWWLISQQYLYFRSVIKTGSHVPNCQLVPFILSQWFFHNFH